MFKMKYPIKTDYIAKNSLRRSGLPMKNVVFIVAHDTGNDGSTAQNNVDHYKNTKNLMEASAHTFIDDVDIIECVPLSEKAWHVTYDSKIDNELYGVNANDSAIGVELCYTHKRGKINNKEAYKRYVWYIAYLCHTYGITPKTHIVGHNELDPFRRFDPFKNSLELMGISQSQFINDVVWEYNDCREVMRVNEKTLEEARKAIDKLAAKGLINSPDYWKERLEESFPVWAYFIIEGNKLEG